MMVPGLHYNGPKDHLISSRPLKMVREGSTYLSIVVGTMLSVFRRFLRSFDRSIGLDRCVFEVLFVVERDIWGGGGSVMSRDRW